MVETFANKVAWITKFSTGILAGIMTMVVFVEVISRYLLQESIFFSEELSRLAFVWASFLAISLGFRTGIHINVQFILNVIPVAQRRLILLLSEAVILLFLSVVFISSITILPHHWDELTPTIGITMFWFYLAVPVGVALMIIQVLPLFEKTIKGRL